MVVSKWDRIHRYIRVLPRRWATRNEYFFAGKWNGIYVVLFILVIFMGRSTKLYVIIYILRCVCLCEWVYVCVWECVWVAIRFWEHAPGLGMPTPRGQQALYMDVMQSPSHQIWTHAWTHSDMEILHNSPFGNAATASTSASYHLADAHIFLTTWFVCSGLLFNFYLHSVLWRCL